ncbi:MAG: lysine--tRNA ligase [Fimbriimonadaceae bacterium]|nr:lysine--tRNA ligase [Fimbriimonadaceae bacterium]
MSEEKSLREIRLDKLERLRELGLDPYAVERFERTHSPQEVLDQFESLSGDVKVAGRVHSYRLMGKAGFAHISDGDGKIQGYFRRDDMGETLWEAYNLLDIGDHIGIIGEPFVTKTGERSIHVKSFVPMSKSLQNLPLGKEKDGQQWYGLSDVEQRYRHRHLDLVANPEARRDLVNRCKIVSSVRRFMDGRGYLEVETPMLQFQAGGAAARPFLTHYNAYDTEVKLRISLELYLKRLICGDLSKVYEIGRVFRNEGVSNRHNPEFTLLEYYEAYSNLEDIMESVEAMFRHVALEVFGTTVVSIPGKEGEIDDDGVPGVELDFGKPWARVDMMEAIEMHTGLQLADFADLETAKAAVKERQVSNPITGKQIVLDGERNLGGLIEKLLEVFVEPTLQQPTFVVGYPLETSPLAKHDPNRKGFTRRFEGYVRGREVCNAFSEINDPIDQRARFEQQLREAAKGDDEAHPMDEEFIYALEAGMPPCGGCGIGLDRMAMLLTGADVVREVLLFPLMKPE